MSQSQTYRIDAPNTVHETIDHEVIIVNLATGSYYSSQDAGAAVWNLLDAGLAPQEIAPLVADHFGVTPDIVLRDLDEFTIYLQREQLLLPADDSRTADSSAVQSALGQLRATAYAAPQMTKYGDMEDMLVMDPIHEVDEEAGWPVKSGE